MTRYNLPDKSSQDWYANPLVPAVADLDSRVGRTERRDLLHQDEIAAASELAVAAQAAAQSAMTAAEAAQAVADGAIRTYYLADPPWANGSSQPDANVGDLWFETDTNIAYRWDGSTWQIIQDTSIATALAAAQNAQTTADGKITAYYQTTPPWAEADPAHDNDVGDLWYDTDDKNKPYYYDGTFWIEIRDGTIADAAAAAVTASTAASAANTVALNAMTAAQAAQATADGAIRTYYQSSAPTGLNNTTDLGDLWFNTTDQSAHRWNGTSWELIQDTSIASALAAAQNAQTTADGKITAYYQTTAPTTAEIGDLFYDTDDKNKPYYCSAVGPPAVWTAIRDATIADAQASADQAIVNAQTAADKADGKAVTYFQDNQPTGQVATDAGDLWFDTNDGYKMYRYTGSAWVVAQDTAIGQAQAAAIGAQNTANTKITTFYDPSQPSGTGRTIGDLWVDTDAGNLLSRWSGTGWVALPVGGQALAPGAVTHATVGTDGSPPTVAPGNVKLIGGVGALFARWDPIVNNDPVTYEVHISTSTGFTATSATLAVATSSSSYTIRALPDGTALAYNTTYYVKVRAKDADPGYGPFSAEVSDKLVQVSNPDIAADYAYFGNVAVDQVTAGTLAVDVVTGGFIRTALTGARVEISSAGAYWFDSTGIAPTISLPTDPGATKKFTGDVEAGGLTVTGGASFRSASNEISKGATLNLQRSSTPPLTAPSAVIGWPDSVVYNNFAWTHGLCWTGTDWATAADTVPPHIERSVGADIDLPTGAPRPWGGVVALGGFYYTLGKSFNVDTYFVTRYSSSGVTTLAQVVYTPISGANGSGGNTASGLAPAAIGTDGTNILIAEFDSANQRYRIQTRDPTSLAVTATLNTQAAAGFTGPVVGVRRGSFDLGATRTIILSRVAGFYYAFDASGNYLPAESWSSPSPGTMSGFDWDGTRFWGTAAKSGNPTVFKHTTTKWLSNDPQTWYATTTWRDTDPTGGTHETTMGPVQTITMKKRAALTLTSATIPDEGGTDDPNAVAFYLSNSSTLRTAMWQQTLPADGVNTVTLKDDVTFAGINPPTSNNFPASPPAKIRNSDDTLSISGDGSIAANSMSIAGAPVATKAYADGLVAVSAARVRRNAVQAMPTGATTPFAWDAVVSDSGGMVPVVANGIKVVAAGKYRISGSVALDYTNTTVLLHLAVQVNAASVKVVHRGSFASPSTPTVVTFCVDEWQLVANDVVTLALFHARGSDVNTYVTGATYMTELAMRRLGP